MRAFCIPFLFLLWKKEKSLIRKANSWESEAGLKEGYILLGGLKAGLPIKDKHVAWQHPAAEEATQTELVLKWKCLHNSLRLKAFLHPSRGWSKPISLSEGLNYSWHILLIKMMHSSFNWMEFMREELNLYDHSTMNVLKSGITAIMWESFAF